MIRFELKKESLRIYLFNLFDFTFIFFGDLEHNVTIFTLIISNFY